MGEAAVRAIFPAILLGTGDIVRHVEGGAEMIVIEASGYGIACSWHEAPGFSYSRMVRAADLRLVRRRSGRK